MADTVPSHSDWLPGPVQTLEYEGRTVEIECWLSPSPVTLTFPPEALLKHPPISIDDLNEELDNPSEPKDDE